MGWNECSISSIRRGCRQPSRVGRPPLAAVLSCSRGYLYFWANESRGTIRVRGLRCPRSYRPLFPCSEAVGQPLPGSPIGYHSGSPSPVLVLFQTEPVLRANDAVDDPGDVLLSEVAGTTFGCQTWPLCNQRSPAVLLTLYNMGLRNAGGRRTLPDGVTQEAQPGAVCAGGPYHWCPHVAVFHLRTAALSS